MKETDWSATDIVRGVDGVRRRWVYLHYFKQGQPTLNWLDPTFAAERLVIGDAVDELGVLGDRMVRLDANGLLGIERNAAGTSGGRPSAVDHGESADRRHGAQARRIYLRGARAAARWMKEMSRGGPDLSYDFVTRPITTTRCSPGTRSPAPPVSS